MRRDNKIAIREKEILAMETELSMLHRASYDLGYYELEIPVRNGWHKELTLSKRLSRRKNAEVYEAILDLCGVRVWANNRADLEQKWLRDKVQPRNLHYPGMLFMNRKRYKKLPPQLQAYFVSQIAPWSRYKKPRKVYRCTVPEDHWEVRYRRSYITHRKIIDSKIEKRITELNERLDDPRYYNMVRKGLSGRWVWGRNTSIQGNRKKTKQLLSNWSENTEFKNEFIYSPKLNQW